MCCLKLIYIFVIWTNVILVESLKKGDKGVCAVNISIPKSRIKYVTTDKWCGKKKCVRKINEKYSVHQQRVICCNGWHHNDLEDVCTPTCSFGCEGGTCTAPEVCTCPSPSYIDPDKKNICIQPVCEPPCYNGDCISNNTCQCKLDFTQYNSTHCFECPEGYFIDSELNCQPKCDVSCTNGTCTGPNICTCNEGYRPKDASVCEAICDCINSTCIAPYQCECFDGFVKINGSVCAPKCGDGFVLSGNNSCERDCRIPTTKVTEFQPTKQMTYLIKKYKKCPEGKKCTRDEAKTVRGFNPRNQLCCSKAHGPKEVKYEPICCVGWMLNITVNLCQPHCSNDCENGYCVKPDTCGCEPPLILEGSHKCVPPKCDLPCVNSKCVNTDTCECNSDYYQVNSTYCAPTCKEGFKNDPITFECTPNCDSPCANATCTGPNACTCFDGYTKSNDYTCVPHCTSHCENSDCVAPDQCLCWDGYKQETKSKCKPVCYSCEHGECLSPNNCKCNDGYTKLDGICKPVCNSCENGDCIAPNICNCHAEYIKTNDICSPVCDECLNGKCIAPNQCDCNDGYAKVDGICKPVCSSCENGDCRAPNKCDCHNGYMKVNDICSPVCDECENGKCIAPKTCVCDEGYAKEYDDICQPVCTEKCVNAFCSSPNICECLEGYEPTNINSTCKPRCSHCDHGYCDKPDECICNDGYTKENDSCVPICYESCINGYCASPNNCSCKEGYTKNFTHSSECYKPCKTSCENGKCNLDGECVCDRGYELVNDTCLLMTMVDCSTCEANCSLGDCWCGDGRPCSSRPIVNAEVTSTGLAGLEMTWIFLGGFGLLVVVLMVTILQRMWKKRKQVRVKEEQANAYGSVVYTTPGTLMLRPREDEYDIEKRIENEHESDMDDAKTPTDKLLTSALDQLPQDMALVNQKRPA